MKFSKWRRDRGTIVLLLTPNYYIVCMECTGLDEAVGLALRETTVHRVNNTDRPFL